MPKWYALLDELLSKKCPSAAAWHDLPEWLKIAVSDFIKKHRREFFALCGMEDLD